jgi:poly-gamma-glutamate synthesis protein (capsule biosynthesis protein)
MKFAQAKNCDNFYLLSNSNSSEIYQHNFIGENTSYVTGYFSQEKKVKNAPVVNILFMGDLMLDRYNRTIIKRNGVSYFTKDFNRFFWSQDLNILNLEGPITGNQTISLDTEIDDKNHFKFTFDKSDTRDFLEYNRINMVNLGNNHILNFGENGARETVDFLKENEVGYFGSPLDDRNSYIEKNINGLKIALVNYNRFYKLGSENTISKIRDAKSKNDFVVVYAHWGNEYELTHSETQKKIAYSFIDNGADLIIGSHPHVVQPIEIYKNKAVFYSLGNFVFDQYFSQDVRNELGVLISFSREKVDFVLVPLYRNNNGSLELSDEKRRTELLDRLAQNSNASELIKEEIRAGSFFTSNN